MESAFTGTNDFQYCHDFLCLGHELLKRSGARNFCAIFKFMHFKVLLGKRGWNMMKLKPSRYYWCLFKIDVYRAPFMSDLLGPNQSNHCDSCAPRRCLGRVEISLVQSQVQSKPLVNQLAEKLRANSCNLRALLRWLSSRNQRNLIEWVRTSNIQRAVQWELNRRIVYTDLGVILSHLALQIC